MKSILERIRKYVGSAGKRYHNRAQHTFTELPPERTSGPRTSGEEPNAEVRRVLATAMLLG